MSDRSSGVDLLAKGLMAVEFYDVDRAWETLPPDRRSQYIRHVFEIVSRGERYTRCCCSCSPVTYGEQLIGQLSIRLDENADILTLLERKNARLRAQVDRLRRGYLEYEAMYGPYRPEGTTDHDIREGYHGLLPGDLDPLERDDGYTGPRIYVGGSEIRPFRDIVEDDDGTE